MRCEYNDGMRVSYAGPLRIRKGNEVNVFLDPDEIPPDIHGELFEAAFQESCSELRHVAEEVIETVGTNLPE